jgi:hypothetical protein
MKYNYGDMALTDDGDLITGPGGDVYVTRTTAAWPKE